jgi:hypothetical protein
VACTSGGCCDTKNKVFLAKGKTCTDSSSVVATQYQCGSGVIEKRTAKKGCNGVASVCQTSSNYYVWSGWSTHSSCIKGYGCVPNKLNTKPGTCVKLGDCSSGACCDTKAKKFRPAKYKCSSKVVQTKISCSGSTKLYKQTAYYGCSGSSSSCPSSSSTYNWAYSTIPCQSYEKCAMAKAGAYCHKYADLKVTSVSIFSTYYVGQTISGKYTIKNYGKATASGTFYTTPYLSQNTSTTSGNVNKGNKAQSSLVPGASRTVSFTVPLAKIMQSGKWYIGVRADSTLKVTEYNENDNWYWKSFTVPKRVYVDTKVAEYKTPLVGSYPFGSAVSYKCPYNSVAIGVSAYYSSYIRKYRLYCRNIHYSGSHSTAYYTSFLGKHTYGFHQIYYGSNGSYMVRANGRFSSNNQESIQGYTRTWQEVLKGYSNSSGKALPNIGDTSGNSLYYSTCPNGYVITGIYGTAFGTFFSSSNSVPRKMGFYCRKLYGAW